MYFVEGFVKTGNTRNPALKNAYLCNKIYRKYDTNKLCGKLGFQSDASFQSSYKYNCRVFWNVPPRQFELYGDTVLFK